MIKSRKPKIILIKIGGSLITDKNKAFSLNQKNLRIINQEINNLFKSRRFKIILGHGSGSFGHSVAAKYQTQDGVDFSDKEKVLGMAKVKEAASRLNQIVIQSLLGIGVPAVSLHPDSFIFSRAKKLTMSFWQNLNFLLTKPLLPVVYGDVIFDGRLGATIFSTEMILAEIAKMLVTDGYQVSIVHCGATEGVYDQEGKTIPLITLANFKEIKKMIGGSAGVDVTGGMIHKVKISLELTKIGITSYITDGVSQGSLSRLLLAGKTDKVTVIR